MKFIIPCPKCRDADNPLNFNYVDIDINHHGIYKLTCCKGHNTVTILQEEHFEVLFELGGLALIDSYTREAVASFAASLERFHEFCVRVILDHNKVELSEVDQAWKLVSSQSERQLGAFYFLVLNELKKSPQPLINNAIAFRNEVIHKGHIPKYEDVLTYGGKLYSYMTEFLRVLNDKYHESIMNVYMHNRGKSLPEEFTQVEINAVSIPTMINLSRPNDCLGQVSFDESMSNLEARIKNFYSK
ncbi:hypothetical protein BEP19_15795 [Ammoniphilus oxalaticus]|uniref:Uncharacterized protein n=1 Tax=Ammoniphilus oxalaticus TaxID=66863 RepID=A0A419SE24_9BACL|nr:hypothetical protein [Ammoniphilus oxalaticus]RKD21133.1 hypothetical protein BEP19_15795 [Ammoniphilus oxalaticus]